MDILRATLRLEVAADSAFDRKPILHDLSSRLDIAEVPAHYSGRYVVTASGITVHIQDMQEVALLYVYNLSLKEEVRVTWTVLAGDAPLSCTARLAPQRFMLVPDVSSMEDITLSTVTEPATVELLIAGK